MTQDNEIVPFAKTNYRGQERKFGIRVDDRRRHIYIIGKTGMGKTTLLENMAIADIQGGRGLAIVDPHGQFADKMLDFVPPQRINDVIYFNPADYDYPIAFNIFERVEPHYKHLIADGLVGVFKKIWADSWGPRLEYILRNAILALLDYPSSTLLGVTRILVDKDYRRKVVQKIQDPVVRSFWVNEYANYSENFRNEAISPIQNKVGQFLSSSLIRNIIGQPQSSVNIRDVMDHGKILLMNIAKGKVGEENSALLGAMMITKIQLAAMSRADIAEEERHDFYLYIDEFQNFSTDSFANILSEARKYRLNLIMAHQYITQMEEKVRDAVFGNVGTIVCFRVGAMDAEFLEPEFQPVFTQLDLVNLTKFEIYLKLMIDGVASDAFSAMTLPPIEEEVPKYPEAREKIIRISRERYATPRAVVEERINRWSGMEEGGKSGGGVQGGTQAREGSRPWPQQQQRQEEHFKRIDARTVAPSKPAWDNFSRRFPPQREVEPVAKHVPPSISLSEALKQRPQSFSASDSRLDPGVKYQNHQRQNNIETGSMINPVSPVSRRIKPPSTLSGNDHRLKPALLASLKLWRSGPVGRSAGSSNVVKKENRRPDFKRVDEDETIKL
ncbi:MAG: type IV secretion system DNA-binding domain-containing protein [Candidatus Doudnabacteria bacterium]